MTKGCDLELGICEMPSSEDLNKKTEAKPISPTLYYVGDPMCSWCWGISPSLKKIEQYCEENNIRFETIVGGLRAGGGDAWNIEFRSFLRKEWSHIEKVTGQPFSYTLLEKDFFNYDTEPACRGVVVLCELIDEKKFSKKLKLEAFSKIQKKFYTEGQDPKEVSFYKDICNEFGIPYEKFHETFTKSESFAKTRNEFLKAASLKVGGFPSLVLVNNSKSILVSSGFVTPEKAITIIEDSIKSFI